MSQGITQQLDVKDLMLSNGSFGPNEIRLLAESISENPMQFKILRTAVAELESNDMRTPATSVRLGVGLYILGRFDRASKVLANADGGALSYYYLGKSQVQLEQYTESISSFQSAQKGGYSPDDCALAISAAHRLSGNAETAINLLNGLSRSRGTNGRVLVPAR